MCSYREFNLKYHDELIKPFPGVKETLSVLQQRGIKMAVVTSKKVPMAKRGLQCMGLETYIEAVIDVIYVNIINHIQNQWRKP